MADTFHESTLVLDDLAWQDLAAIAQTYLDFWDLPRPSAESERRIVLAKRIVEVA